MKTLERKKLKRLRLVTIYSMWSIYWCSFMAGACIYSSLENKDNWQHHTMQCHLLQTAIYWNKGCAGVHVGFCEDAVGLCIVQPLVLEEYG